MKVKRSFLFGSIFIPLVAMTLLALLASVMQLKQDINLSANTLLRYGEDLSVASWRVTAKTKQLAGVTCPDMLAELNRTRAFTPYIRDIGLLENGYITCSFVTGAKEQPFPLPEGKTLPTPLSEKWVTSLNRMLGGPERPVVIYAEKITDNKTAFVIVDSRYIQELMDVLATERSAKFTLRFGTGDLLVSQPEEAARIFMTQHYSLPKQQISLAVATPSTTLTSRWMQNLLFFIPLSICLSFLTIVLYRQWCRIRFSLAREITKGIKNDQFIVHYQPVLNVNHKCCGGVEALLRWPQPEGNFITPDIFITAAENEGMIVPLSRHLFRLIAQDVNQWQLPESFYISVNISPQHLIHDDFITDVEVLMAALGNIQLMLEVTERTLITQPELVAEKLTILREKGVLIAIDDFGTGYCSLAYLQQLPANYLKIDRTFVDTIDTSGSNVPILDTIITLCQKLGLDIIAEGVSTQQQLRYILGKDVGFIQGYLYAKPMSAIDFMAWLADTAGQNEMLTNSKC